LLIDGSTDGTERSIRNKEVPTSGEQIILTLASYEGELEALMYWKVTQEAYVLSLLCPGLIMSGRHSFCGFKNSRRRRKIQSNPIMS